MKSERTTLVCWSPKRCNEIKIGLIQWQPGMRVPKDTHTHTLMYQLSGPLSEQNVKVLGGICMFFDQSRSLLLLGPLCDLAKDYLIKQSD